MKFILPRHRNASSKRSSIPLKCRNGGARKASIAARNFSATCAQVEAGAPLESAQMDTPSKRAANTWKSIRHGCWFTRGLPVGPAMQKPPCAGNWNRRITARSSEYATRGFPPIPNSPKHTAAGRESSDGFRLCWSAGKPSTTASPLLRPRSFEGCSAMLASDASLCLRLAFRLSRGWPEWTTVRPRHRPLSFQRLVHYIVQCIRPSIPVDEQAAPIFQTPGEECRPPQIGAATSFRAKRAPSKFCYPDQENCAARTALLQPTERILGS